MAQSVAQIIRQMLQPQGRPSADRAGAATGLADAPEAADFAEQMSQAIVEAEAAIQGEPARQETSPAEDAPAKSAETTGPARLPAGLKGEQLIDALVALAGEMDASVELPADVDADNPAQVAQLIARIISSARSGATEVEAGSESPTAAAMPADVQPSRLDVPQPPVELAEPAPQPPAVPSSADEPETKDEQPGAVAVAAQAVTIAVPPEQPAGPQATPAAISADNPQPALREESADAVPATAERAMADRPAGPHQPVDRSQVTPMQPVASIEQEPAAAGATSEAVAKADVSSLPAGKAPAVEQAPRQEAIETTAQPAAPASQAAVEAQPARPMAPRKTAGGEPGQQPAPVAGDSGDVEKAATAVEAKPSAPAAGPVEPRQPHVADEQSAGTDTESANPQPPAVDAAPRSADAKDEQIPPAAPVAHAAVKVQTPAPAAPVEVEPPAGAMTATPAGPAESSRPVAVAAQPSGAPSLVEFDADASAERVMRAISTQFSGRNGTMRLQLDPPGLGELRVQVTMGGNNVRVSLLPASQPTAELLGNQLHHLRQALESQGLSVTRLEIETPRPQGAAFGQGDRPGEGLAQQGHPQGGGQGRPEQGSQGGQGGRGGFAEFFGSNRPVEEPKAQGVRARVGNNSPNRAVDLVG